MTSTHPWPELPYAAWKDTCATLQLWTQVVGKVRLALTPWLNHSWHVALYVTARGLTTSPIPYGGASSRSSSISSTMCCGCARSDGHVRQLMLRPMSVAEFYADVMHMLADLGIAVRINEMPNEIPDAVPFQEDRAHASYDRDYAQRFWRVLLASHDVFAHFRTGFLGKVSPVHFFWGSFRPRGDALFRPPRAAASRRRAEPARCRRARGLFARGVERRLLAGRRAIDYAAFYSYAYPAPDGFASAPVKPADAFFSKELGEFILPYDAVRTAREPERALMDFLQSTYAAAADLAKWERAELECGLGEPAKVRSA